MLINYKRLYKDEIAEAEKWRNDMARRKKVHNLEALLYDKVKLSGQQTDRQADRLEGLMD